MIGAFCSFAAYWLVRLDVWREERRWVRPYWDRRWSVWRVPGGAR